MLNPPTCCPPTFCTVTTTAAVLPTVTSVGALTLVTARSAGGCTVIPIPTLLFEPTSSGSFCVANRVCPVVVTPAVFQGISTVVVAPTARPATVCVPTSAPPQPSVRATSKLVLTSSSPTFFSVT